MICSIMKFGSLEAVDHEPRFMIEQILGRVRHLGAEFLVGAAVLVVGAAVGAGARGWAGAVGVGLGVLLVVASYTVSTLAIAWADWVNPRMVFPVGMAMYVTKFSLFGAMMIVVGATDWPGRIPMAMGIVAEVVAWSGTQIWWTVRTAHPYARP
jgi:hypothetical protein